MFNKTALSWQMQYETRWCIKQHSHLFYYTWNKEEIYGTFHIIWTTSCALRSQKLQLPGLIEKANTWAASMSSLCLSHEGQKTTATLEVPGPGVFMFLLKSHERELLQLTLTISRLTLQSSRIQTVDWCFFKNVWNYCNLFPSCTLLFKPFKRNHTPETSLVVKRLRRHVPNTGGPGSIPDQGISSQCYK